MFNDVHNVSLNKLRKVSLNNMLFNKLNEFEVMVKDFNEWLLDIFEKK